MKRSGKRKASQRAAGAKANAGTTAKDQAQAHPKTAAPAAKAKGGMDRRALLGWLQVGGGAALLFGGVGYYAVSSTMTTLSEQDLSRIGNGVPTVVQIHDPNCPQCAALQREARAAMDAMDPGALDYVVANIKTAEGARYARLHGVGHVTLLLVDGQGEVVNVLQGVRDRAELTRAFTRHVAAAGS
ncbi:MAG: hypothetical protein AAFR44_03910 [Pseudomonadota bacterium]